MLITDDIFQAFLQCETKAHLKLSGAAGDQRAFPDWERTFVEDYKRQCHRQLGAAFRGTESLLGGAFPQDLANRGCRLVLDCRVRAQAMQSYLHVWNGWLLLARRTTARICRSGVYRGRKSPRRTSSC